MRAYSGESDLMQLIIEYRVVEFGVLFGSWRQF